MSEVEQERRCTRCGVVITREMHPAGYYHQYHSQECETAHDAEFLALALEKTVPGQILAVVTQEYVYTLPNIGSKPPHGHHYEFRQFSHEGGMMMYCYIPGLFGKGMTACATKMEDQLEIIWEVIDCSDRPIRVIKLDEGLEVTWRVKDKDWGSTWSMVGLRFPAGKDGPIDTYGVGGKPVVIDRRKEEGNS